MRTYNHRYYRQHREKAATHNRRYRAEHQEEAATYQCCWRQEHPEEVATYKRRWRNGHREERAAYQRRRQKENPQEAAAACARYRARKRGIANTLTPEQARYLFVLGRATYPGEKLHLDHVVPLSKGGGTTLANMHAIPAGLNHSKKDTLPEEIYRQVELFCWDALKNSNILMEEGQ